MKRYAHLYEQITSVDNCRMAILNAAKHKKRRKKVQEIMANLDYYAEDLSQRLQNLTFLTPYIQRTIHDHSSGKLRELQIPAFYPDQCAHHAIVQVLQPIIMKSSYIGAVQIYPAEELTMPALALREPPKETRNTLNTV